MIYCYQICLIHYRGMLRRELKEKFLRDFTPEERVFFLKKAREAVYKDLFPPNEDLFFYCYFLTIRERLRKTLLDTLNGFARIILAETVKEVEDTIKDYYERLQKQKAQRPPAGAISMFDYLVE